METIGRILAPDIVALVGRSVPVMTTWRAPNSFPARVGRHEGNALFEARGSVNWASRLWAQRSPWVQGRPPRVLLVSIVRRLTACRLLEGASAPLAPAHVDGESLDADGTSGHAVLAKRRASAALGPAVGCGILRCEA